MSKENKVKMANLPKDASPEQLKMPQAQQLEVPQAFNLITSNLASIFTWVRAIKTVYPSLDTLSIENAITTTYNITVSLQNASKPVNGEDKKTLE